jgi:thiol-disulfide isomerase/thioredoxin
MRKNILFLVLALLCSNFSSKGQGKNADSLSFKIGDQLPEIFWHQEHLLYRNGKTTKQDFSAYKGKLIIIDFWATWCGSCLVSFPKLALLERQFENQISVIKVTDQSAEELLEFEHGLSGEKLRKKSGSELVSLVQDKALASLFPHHLIPHLAYIGGDGKVLGFSDADELNAEVIREMLEGHQSTVLNKQDYNTDLPLFLGDARDKLLSYSVLYKGHITGLSMGSYYRRKDDLVYGKAMTNFPLLNLYTFAAGQIYQWLNDKRIILEVAKPGELTAYNLDSSNPQMKLSLYTVDISCAFSRADSLYTDMLKLLNSNTSYSGTVEQRVTKCLVLTGTGEEPSARLNSEGGSVEVHYFDDGMAGVITNARLSDFVVALNNLEKIKPLVIDETGVRQPVDLRLASFTNLEALNKELKRYGLQIKEAERLLEVFVIREKRSAN